MYHLTLALCAFQSPLRKSSLPGNVLFDPLRLSTVDLTWKRSDPPRPSEQVLYDLSLIHI